jgi:hypothetical protein
MATSTESRTDPITASAELAGIPVMTPGSGSPSPSGPSTVPPSSTSPVAVDGNITPTGAATTNVSPEPGYPVRIESVQLFPGPGVSDTSGITITRERTFHGASQRLNQLVVKTGNDDDDVQVTQRSDGKLDIAVNGQPFEVTLAAGQELAVRTNGGNDIVHAAPNVRVNMTVDGGAGDDNIITGAGQDRVDGGLGNDNIVTGDGKDYAFGNSGDDRISTGAGDDVAYGGDGQDRLIGGEGRDFINGGKDNDTIDGGVGNDILSGGLGNDTVRSGEGNDRVYIGTGADTIQNDTGNDVVYGQSDSNTIAAATGASNDRRDVAASATLGSSIVIEGDDAFKQRVEADLDLLRSSPEGRQMLTALDEAAARGNAVTIRDTHGLRSNSVDSPGAGAFFNPDGTAGSGVDAVVRYNPSNHITSSSPDRPPVVGLYHELSHAYNVVNGTMRSDQYNNPGHVDHGIRNFERQAIGQDTGVPSDFDRNPATPATNTNPASLTEKALRTEMDLPSRDTYRMPVSTPASTPGGTTSGAPPVPETTSGAAPVWPGVSAPGYVSDPHLDRMLAAMQAGNYDGLRASTRDLADSSFGQAFRNEGTAALNQRDEQRTVQIREEQILQPQQENPNSGPRR